MSVLSTSLLSPASRSLSEPEADLGDLRFRSLLADHDWHALPRPIRRRFSKPLTQTRASVFVGEVVETKVSRIGRLLAGLARLIGCPLPLSADLNCPCIVSVTEDPATGGQNWTRLYARKAGFPRIIQSAQRFCGRTGLEEHVGWGVGMALTLHAEDGALVFRSAGFFLEFRKRQITLPAVLAPWRLSVTHAENGSDRFSFTLEVTHPRLGLLIRQRADFQEIGP